MFPDFKNWIANVTKNYTVPKDCYLFGNVSATATRTLNINGHSVGAAWINNSPSYISTVVQQGDVITCEVDISGLAVYEILKI